jgi:site-specific recombinase XerD
VAQYESARRVLMAAGLDADQGGSFKLRHSFALRQLQAGHDPDDVARWLGVVDPSVMLRYQQLLGDGPPPPALPRFSPPV